jgi:hypothetical protein
MEALVTLLTREKTLVELLVFKLVSMRQLLLTGETRFLPWAAEEVDRATTSVRDAELERAILSELLAAERGLQEPTLGELVADAPDPWRGLLESLHEELREGAREVQDLLASTRRLAEVGVRSLAEAMGQDTGTAAATYGPTGRADKVRVARYEQVL